jgi:hypothetical protein
MKKLIVICTIVTLVIAAFVPAQAAPAQYWLVLGNTNARRVAEKFATLTGATMLYDCQLGGGSITDYAPAKIAACVAKAKAQMGSVKLKGAIIWTGEKDAQTCLHNTDWVRHMEKTIEYIRAKMGDNWYDPIMVFLYPQLGKNPTLGYPCWAQVRARQADVIYSSQTATIYTTDIPRLPGSVLYSAAGYLELAKRFASLKP